MLLLLAACTAPDPDKRLPDDDTALPTDDTGGVTSDPDGDGYADPPAEWVDALETFARQVRSSLRSTNGSGAQYAVWYDGAIIYSGAVGTKDPDTEEVPDAETLYEIGSDTKKITAIALLQAVGRSEISLDDPVAAALPDLSLAADPGWAEATTIRQLLSQQTGLYDYTPWLDEPDDSALAERIDGAFSAGEYTFFPPGVAMSYSNPNYVLAGRAVEELSGRTWADVVTTDIFAPLGLSHTFAHEAEAEAAGDVAIGTGYWTTDTDWSFSPWENPEWQFGRVALADHPDPAFLRPAGCVWSTAEDQVRLMGALIDGMPDVLPDEERAEMETAQVLLYGDWSNVGYGFGLYVQPGFGSAGQWYDEPILAHGGATLSYTSATYALPERRLAVVVLSNGYGDYVDPVVTDLLAEIGTDGAVSTTEEQHPPPLATEAYAGDYLDEHLVGRVTLTANGDTLTMSAPDLDAAGIDYSTTVTPYLESLLLAEINGYSIAWSVAADGDTTWLVDRSLALHETAAARMARPHPVDRSRVFAELGRPRVR